MQFVRLAGKQAQLVCRLCAAGRFAEQSASERQRLVGADDVAARTLRRYEARLLAREQACNFTRRRKPGIPLHGTLVDTSGNGIEWNTGIGEQDLPCLALRSQDQSIFSTPNGHR